MTILEAKHALEESRRIGDLYPEQVPDRLPLSAIGRIPELFQYRRLTTYQSEPHIKNLAAAIRNTGGPLAPILIYWTGEGWTCVDGFHRLEAYVEAEWAKGEPVPVRPLPADCSIDDALACGLGNNSRDKLPMSRAEKTEAAWRLVVGTALSKSKIVRAAGVADGSVGRMRRIHKELRERHPERDLSELSWRNAQRLAEGASDQNVDWDNEIEKEGQEMAVKLRKAIGQRGESRLESFARALEIAYPRMKPFLLEHWQELGETEF